MHIVLGASGGVGGAVARTLLAAGAKVRVFLRDPAKAPIWQAQGAEVAIGHMEEAGSLERAFAGVTGAFVMSPPTPTAPDIIEEGRKHADAIARALETVPSARVAVLSSIAAQVPAGTGLIGNSHALETRLARLGRPMTLVRACYFMENWAGSVAVAKQAGVLPSMLPLDLRIEMVAREDIGRVAAEQLLTATPEPIVELAGPQDYTPAEVATAVASILGKPIQAVPVPDDERIALLTGHGLSQDFAELMVEMLGALKTGHVSRPAGARLVRGELGLTEALRQFG